MQQTTPTILGQQTLKDGANIQKTLRKPKKILTKKRKIRNKFDLGLTKELILKFNEVWKINRNITAQDVKSIAAQLNFVTATIRAKYKQFIEYGGIWLNSKDIKKQSIGKRYAKILQEIYKAQHFQAKELNIQYITKQFLNRGVRIGSSRVKQIKKKFIQGLQNPHSQAIAKKIASDILVVLKEGTQNPEFQLIKREQYQMQEKNQKNKEKEDKQKDEQPQQNSPKSNMSEFAEFAEQRQNKYGSYKESYNELLDQQWI